ncbi:MAG: hypothetical protein K8R76_02030 [Candidatus Aegiribacteria sp.]|nr:hypothetical protein [Candidatus Aegiribacteria sp.]
MRVINQLQEIFNIQSRIIDIHPILERVFPVALVEGDKFLIYDIDESGQRYVFVMDAPTPMPVPLKVRAAFSLECYGGKTACIVTGDVFDSLEGYVTIFHEFVHCQQSETCENELKQTLGIARRAQVENDHMWEINYPFPYDSPDFRDLYALFLDELDNGRKGNVSETRLRLKQILKKNDYEYMVWQEWKEGFARFIENLIRNRLDLAENHGGYRKPYDRVLFYEGGAGYIGFLGLREPRLLVEIEKLFHVMMCGE